ncbi:MAG: baseplate J/gp47 family protein [Chloroflexota bacterium]
MAENPGENQRPYGIAQVEPDDDVASINGKIEAVPEDVVAVAVGRKARQLRNPLHLRLLHRHGENLAKDIIIVSGDATIRSLARAEGFKTFSSLKALERKWAHLLGTGGISWGDILAVVQIPALVIAGIVAVGAALFFVAAYLLPSASVVIKPTSEIVSRTLNITAATRVKAANFDLNQIPARVVEASLETRGRIETTGSRVEPDRPARGQVTFINRSDQRVAVPRGTQVATSGGIKFSTEGEVSLGPTTGATATVGVVAVEPGAVGNVVKSGIDRILDGQLALRLVVVNEYPTGGGTNKETRLVTANDQARLLEKVKEAAQAEAFNQLSSVKRPTESIYPETVQVKIVSAEFDPREGEEAPVLSVRALVDATGVAFDGSDVNKVAVEKLASGAAGVEVQAGSVRVRPLDAYAWDSESVSFRLFVQGRVIPVLDLEEIRGKLVGLKKDAAEGYLLKNFRLAASPEIALYPDWVTSLPLFAWRIEVRVLSDG